VSFVSGCFVLHHKPETMAAAFRPSFLNKKLKDLNPMAVLEPAVFAARSRQLWNRYRTTYLNTGSFAPVIHATLFFGSMGWFATWRVKGGMCPCCAFFFACLVECRTVSAVSLVLCVLLMAAPGHSLCVECVCLRFHMCASSEHRQVYKWH
jgi:hypothetical protein